VTGAPVAGQSATEPPATGQQPQPPVPAWLADPALSRLWDGVRTRLERQHLSPAGRIMLTGLERAERHAIGALLARPVVTDKATVDLAELDRVIAARSPYCGLSAAAAAVTGRPLRDRQAERSAAVAAREEPLALARDLLAAEPVFAASAWAEAWLTAIRRSGMLARTLDSAQAIRHAAAVLATVLARTEPTSRTELAARATGSAHGLDDGTAVAQLVLRALALDAGTDPPASSAARRDLWERYGVSSDALSATCLTLGVTARGDGSVARRLRIAAQSGDPVHLTPRDLRDLVPAPHRHVMVCENPRILEAMAERFGGQIPAVCTAGQPKQVALDLLRRLAAAGTTLRYHGDFDWPGIAIANRLAAESGALPWRMNAPDYAAAVRRSQAIIGLTGAPVTASWDPALRPAMRHLGIAVHEEAVLGDLLTRLSVGELAGP
jgi:uncharacterized protein (TIGR02679 family)